MAGVWLALGAVAAVAASGALGRAVGSLGLRDQGMVDGYWGSQATGILLTTGSHILLLKRSDYVLDPGVWGVPGGAVPVDDETEEPADLLETALEELEQEAGLTLPATQVGKNMRGRTVFLAPNNRFMYTTFIVAVPQSFTKKPLTLNWESDEGAWISERQLSKYRLHPGVKFTLERAGHGVVFWK